MDKLWEAWGRKSVCPLRGDCSWGFLCACQGRALRVGVSGRMPHRMVGPRREHVGCQVTEGGCQSPSLVWAQARCSADPGVEPS